MNLSSSWTILLLTLSLSSRQHDVTAFTTTTRSSQSVYRQISNRYGIISTPPSATTATRIGVSTASEDGIELETPTSRPPPDMKAYASGYTTAFAELPCSTLLPTLTGEIPTDLVGTYFRSGPAMFSAGSIVPPKRSIVQPKQKPVDDGVDGGRMVRHPFEGDGAVLAVTFPGPKAPTDDEGDDREENEGRTSATARFRFVRTNAFTTERKKGLKLYSGMESTRTMGPDVAGGLGNDFPVPMMKHHLKPGLNKSRKNTSNMRTVYWSKKLITLWEGGLPYKLDALALSTEGRSQLGGILEEESPFSGSNAYDPLKQRMLFYGVRQGSTNSKFTLYEFNSKFRLTCQSEFTLPGLAVISDLGSTEKYALVVQPKVKVNGMQFMMSKEPGKTIDMEDGPALLHVLSRNGDSTLKSIELPVDGISDADLHFCNAYETTSSDGEKSIVMDVIRSDGSNVNPTNKSGQEWPWASTVEDYAETCSKKSLWRYTVGLKSGRVEKECVSLLQTSFGVINPAFSGREHSYVYAAVGSMGHEVAPPQGIAKFTVGGSGGGRKEEIWMPKEYEFCGEPMYAPRVGEDESSDEDNGYIISVLYNGKTKESEVVILEAKDVSSGPVARVPLGMGVPHGLYGCFSNSAEANWSADEIDRRSKLADKMESRGNMWNEVKSDFSGLGLRLDDFEEYFGDIL